jgi:6-phosphofructokinase 2
VPPDFARRLVERVAGRGVRLVLDISGPALDAAARADGPAAHLLRMNGDEAGTLLGGAPPDPPAAAALGRRLVARGAAAIVMIGLGRAGSVAVSAAGAWLATPPPVRVVSKTGAGDSFVAGAVLGLAEGAPLPDCLALATAAAADAVTTPATELCSRAGTDALLPRVTTETLGA